MRGDADILIVNASEVITLRGFSNKPASGEDMKKLGIIRGGGIAIKNGKILDVGETRDIVKKYRADEVIDASNKIVLPGFVDAHTHLLFYGSREEELTLKLEGVSYLEILKRGGGILKTVRETRKASIGELIKVGKERLDKMLLHGVTTVEAKSGYGLDVENEIKILEAYRRLNEDHVVDIVSTLLAAHAVPEEYKNSGEYVELIIEEIIPKVAERNLAVFNDVFVEEGVFSYEEGKKILKAGLEYGLRPKVHADEINYVRGGELAVEVNAVSADHLARASDDALKGMANRNIVGVLLPLAPIVLMDYFFPNARKMISFGVPIAIASDFNPNCWVENFQLAMFAATYFLKMTPAEVITATTINAAHAIGMGNIIGSIEAGKQADIIILDAKNYMWVNYRFGANLVNTVIKRGKIVVRDGKIVY